MRARGDEGTITVLAIGFTVVLVMLVTLVVDVSAVFLAQRSLSGAADAAAVAGANALDEDAVYRGATGEVLPLGDVQSAVDEQVGVAGLGERFPGLDVVAGSDGATATVVLGADVPLPFVGVVAPDASWRVEVRASARSPYGP